MDWIKPKADDVMVLCKKCGSKVPASSLKLDLDEKKVICPDCIKNKSIHKEIEEELNKKHTPEIESKQTIQKPMMQASSQKEAEPTRIAHKCNSCGYKFKIDPETRKPKNCPYCNVRVMSF